MGKGSMWLYVGSIGLIIAAIAVTAVIDRSKSQQEDIRAKAGVTTGISAFAVVSSLDESTGTLLVTNLAIGENDTGGQLNEIWTITVPSDTNTSGLSGGMHVNLMLDPTTVNISEHTATALKVTAK